LQSNIALEWHRQLPAGSSFFTTSEISVASLLVARIIATRRTIIRIVIANSWTLIAKMAARRRRKYFANVLGWDSGRGDRKESMLKSRTRTKGD